MRSEPVVRGKDHAERATQVFFEERLEVGSHARTPPPPPRGQHAKTLKTKSSRDGAGPTIRTIFLTGRRERRKSMCSIIHLQV